MLSLSKHLPEYKNGRKILRLRYASLRKTAWSAKHLPEYKTGGKILRLRYASLRMTVWGAKHLPRHKNGEADSSTALGRTVATAAK